MSKDDVEYYSLASLHQIQWKQTKSMFQIFAIFALYEINQYPPFSIQHLKKKLVPSLYVTIAPNL